MLANEAKVIFAEVIDNRCVICGIAEQELCDTPTEWVHEERITYAEIPNDRYLRVAAMKRIKLPKSKPTLGDAYAGFVESTYTFYDLFAAFNREATRFAGKDREESVLTSRAYFRLLAITLKTLEQDFTDFANFYKQQNLTAGERNDFELLTKSVHDMNANFASFTTALRTSIDRKTGPGVMTVDELRHSFINLKREHLKFSLDYSIFMNQLLSQNLDEVLDTLSRAYDDEESANANVH